MSKIYVLLFICIAMVSLGTSQRSESIEICRELREVFTRQCSANIVSENFQGPPGKRGPRAPPGVKGDVGVPGPITEIDYGRINIYVQTEISKMEEKINLLTRKVSEMNEKLINATEGVEIKENCDVQYRQKCFRVILHNTQDVDYREGERLCQNNGWKLANIYSVAHYNVIEQYLRTKLHPLSYVTAWIGMTWRSSDKTVHLSNGQSVSDLQWLNSYPSGTTHAEMNVYVSQTPGSNGNGIMNYRPVYKRRGALCES